MNSNTRGPERRVVSLERYRVAMPRGRTRDEGAQRRVIDAAFELVGSADASRVTINAIAERADVAKQTIYRWWPSRTAVVLDALVDGTMRATPFVETSDVRHDFERHLASVIELFTSPTGRVIRELLGESQADPAVAADFRERFWGPRRALSLANLERGIELGQVRDDIDREIVLDALYGVLWTRLTVGHLPMRLDDARSIIDAVWPAIAAPEP